MLEVLSFPKKICATPQPNGCVSVWPNYGLNKTSVALHTAKGKGIPFFITSRDKRSRGTRMHLKFSKGDRCVQVKAAPAKNSSCRHRSVAAAQKQRAASLLAAPWDGENVLQLGAILKNLKMKSICIMALWGKINGTQWIEHVDFIALFQPIYSSIRYTSWILPYIRTTLFNWIRSAKWWANQRAATLALPRWKHLLVNFLSPTAPQRFPPRKNYGMPGCRCDVARAVGHSLSTSKW